MRELGKKLTVTNYERLTARDGWRDIGPDAEKAARRAQLSRGPEVLDAFDDEHSPFFAKPDTLNAIGDDERAALDALLESRGLANVLRALEGLLASRIDAEQAFAGRNLYHLMRDDAHAYAAECMMRLAHDPRIRDL